MDISVIMIGSNFYNYLDQSLESVANQEGYRDFEYEVILINENTVDRGQTDSKIEDWKRKVVAYRPFDFLAFKHPGGVSPTEVRNFARKKARASIVAYLSPRDTMAKDRLLTIFNLFTTIYTTGSHLIYSAYEEKGRIIEPAGLHFERIPFMAIAHNKTISKIKTHYSPIVAGSHYVAKERK